MASRLYSISSSAYVSPNSIDLTVAVARFRTPEGKLHEGVCSHFLASLRPGDVVPCYVKHSLFKLPSNPSVPLILIGAGSGLAPLRAFLTQRYHKTVQNVRTGDALLIFGCDHKGVDDIYSEEIEQMMEHKRFDLTVVTAYAFDGPEVVFVQHRMRESHTAHVIRTMVREGAYVYVCGSSAMASGVEEAMQEILGGGSQGQETLKEMRQIGRYQVDCF
mmetsp:Transcript_5354/g.13457  ORF Transcript_5354/g.13457 Transcript_5354/m.13457 type:complete len:218 (-) Transcript_5354:129-782(-)